MNEAEEEISSALSLPELPPAKEQIRSIKERLEGLSEAYQKVREVMRFHYYRPDKVLAQFRQFAKEAGPYRTRVKSKLLEFDDE